MWSQKNKKGWPCIISKSRFQRMDDRNDGHVGRHGPPPLTAHDIDMYLYLICWLHSPCVLLRSCTGPARGLQQAGPEGAAGDYSSVVSIIADSFQLWCLVLLLVGLNTAIDGCIPEDPLIRNSSSARLQNISSLSGGLRSPGSRPFPFFLFRFFQHIAQHIDSSYAVCSIIGAIPSHCFRRGGVDFLCANRILNPLLSLSLSSSHYDYAFLPLLLLLLLIIYVFSMIAQAQNHQFNRCSACSFVNFASLTVSFLPSFFLRWWGILRTSEPEQLDDLDPLFLWCSCVHSNGGGMSPIRKTGRPASRHVVVVIIIRSTRFIELHSSGSFFQP